MGTIYFVNPVEFSTTGQAIFTWWRIVMPIWSGDTVWKQSSLKYLVWTKYIFLLYGWIHKWARWRESCVLISYLSGQYRLILCAGDLPHRSQKKKVLLLTINNNCNKSFIDQAYSVNMAGYCLLLFCIFIDLDFVSVYKKKRKRTWPIVSHLDLLLGQ